MLGRRRTSAGEVAVGSPFALWPSEVSGPREKNRGFRLCAGSRWLPTEVDWTMALDRDRSGRHHSFTLRSPCPRRNNRNERCRWHRGAHA